jgi:hypothetical protein
MAHLTTHFLTYLFVLAGISTIFESVALAHAATRLVDEMAPDESTLSFQHAVQALANENQGKGTLNAKDCDKLANAAVSFCDIHGRSSDACKVFRDDLIQCKQQRQADEYKGEASHMNNLRVGETEVYRGRG